MPPATISIPSGERCALCRRNRIRKLALYGSVLTDRCSDTSDVDVLVELEPAHRVGYLGMAALEQQLSGLLGARKIHLRTPSELSPYFRDQVLATAAVQYERE